MRRTLTAVLLLGCCGSIAAAACPPSCPIAGGGPAEQDCHAELATTAMRLNWPPHDPADPRPAKEARCFDGEVGCDRDGQVNNECAFPIDVCLLNEADPALPSCSPSPVTAVKVAKTSDPDLQSLQAALDALLPAAGGGNVCTTDQRLRVPLKGPNGRGGFKRGKATLRLKATTAAGVDADTVKLSCVPHGWPSHGYDHANHRANPLETRLSPATAADLMVKWQIDLVALEGTPLNAVTSTPTAGNGLVYVTSWNGNLYALKPRSGQVKWKYESGSGFIGFQSSATLTADERLVVGDSTASVHCLHARTGALLWKTAIGDPTIDHVWASPAVANGRVFVGLASHTDVPCTQGRLVALDLDTGAHLWTVEMVPDRICSNDTAIACASEADCGGGTCVFARGAGVTATVAVDESGETVFANTVGCYTFPSIADSDTIMRVEAASGTVAWKNRVQPPEQFGYCSHDSSIDCGTDAVCGAGNTCTTKGAYHDFGFLNGPLLVDADDGAGGTRRLVASGSKDGTLYALDPDNGAIVWKRAVRPTPVSPAFAGFGLFNAAVGFADQRFYASLYQFAPASNPEPEHLMAFSAVDGATLWEDEIGRSWGSVGLGGGLLFVGTQSAPELYVYDAGTGSRLRTFATPANVTSGAAIADGMAFVGYGVLGGDGGVIALGLP
jgi:polyvinyl alcohol dehydrogenase (cytochrome)